MLRTQISLTDEDRALLDAESQRTGRSLSALIRDAVQAAYGNERSATEDLRALRLAFGAWSDHDEDGADQDGAATVERLRSGSRLARR